MKTIHPVINLICFSLALSACASKQHTTMIDKTRIARDNSASEINAAIHASDRIPTFVDSPFVEPIRMGVDTQWAKSIGELTLLTDITKPVPATEVLRVLQQKGVNIRTSLPLSDFKYAGLGVRNADLKQALQLLLGGMGLDFEINHQDRIVDVLPMRTETYFLALGNTSGSFSTGGSSGGDTSSSSSSDEDSESSGSSSSIASGGVTTIASTDAIWESLLNELTGRTMLMVPCAKSESSSSSFDDQSQGLIGFDIPVNTGSESGQEDCIFEEKQVGTVTVTPETGAIVVQAPHWIQTDIKDYIENHVRPQYTSRLEFEGQLLRVTYTSAKNEGIDISGFSDFASGEGFIINNNALNGLTVSSSRTSATTQDVLGSTLVGGVLGASNPFEVFNGYLDQFGELTVLQEPKVTTTSGRPGKLEAVTIQTFDEINQEAASGGTGSAAVATQNSTNEYEFGIRLEINPIYDVEQDIVRAQILINQQVLSGTRNRIQIVTNADGSSDQIATLEPIVSRLVQSGEVVLRDGDLIIIGGQTTHNQQDNDQGLSGTSGFMFARPFTRVKRTETEITQTFFALRVKVRKV